MKEWIGRARTVEQAVERGLAALGARREDVHIHVVEERASGLLSLFGHRRAVVRLTDKRAARPEPRRSDDDRAERFDRRDRDDRRNRGEPREGRERENRRNRDGRRDRSDGQRPHRNDPRDGDRRGGERHGERSPNDGARSERDDRRRRDRRDAPDDARRRGGPAREPRREEAAPRPRRELPAEERTPDRRAEERAPRPESFRPPVAPETLLAQWKDALGCDDLAWEIAPEENGRVSVLLKTSWGERLAGRGGKPLDAFEYLFNLVSSGGDRSKPRVAFRIDGFASPEEQTVVDRALHAAFQVRRSQRPFRLDPMPPAQRRLVHQTLANHPDVETASEGEGAHRKVVVKPRAAGASSTPTA